MPDVKRKDILLEIGTNELEIMEFMIGDRSFGINVAKVLEIMKLEEITPIPHSNKYIEGIFKPRNQIITVLDMAAYLGLTSSESSERDILIITNFNSNHTAFHVHSVETIHRISWSDMEKPDESIYTGMDGITTGIARIGERLITILDFEKIMGELNPSHTIKISDLGDTSQRPISQKPIFVVEDSPFLQKILIECLHKAGYMNTITFSHGKEAWEEIERLRNKGENIKESVTCIITDIEMPQMDGHMLTKLVKADKELKSLPVIIFSSLINDEMKLKGERLGANAQVSKPEIHKLVTYIDDFTRDTN